MTIIEFVTPEIVKICSKWFFVVVTMITVKWSCIIKCPFVVALTTFLYSISVSHVSSGRV